MEGPGIHLVEERKKTCKQKLAILCIPSLVKQVLAFHAGHIRPFLSRGGKPLVKSKKAKGPDPSLPIYYMPECTSLDLSLRARVVACLMHAYA